MVSPRPLLLLSWAVFLAGRADAFAPLTPSGLVGRAVPASTLRPAHCKVPRGLGDGVAAAGRALRMAAEGGGGGAEEAAATVRIVAAVCERDGKVLMVERTRRSRGFWEFPGGKIEEGETDEDALIRELGEELRVTGKVGDKVAVGRDGPVELTSYHVDIEGEIDAHESLTVRWVDLQEELWKIATPPADAETTRALLKKRIPQKSQE